MEPHGCGKSQKYQSLPQIMLEDPICCSDFGHILVSEQVIILSQLSGLKLVLLYCMPNQGILEWKQRWYDQQPTKTAHTGGWVSQKTGSISTSKKIKYKQNSPQHQLHSQHWILG